MKFYFLICAIMVISLCFVWSGSAEQIPDEKNYSENIWNGTWASEYYTLLIRQNGSEITGWYEPKDLKLYDPGLLNGSISAEGKIFSGMWIESGPLRIIQSGDGMSYSGSGGIRSDAKLNESGTYTASGTRMESSFDPEKIWAGTWKTERTLNTWVQNGTSITGSYQPLAGIEDEPGLFEGTASENGKTLSGTWIETGNFSFTLSEDNSVFNGTYGWGLNASAGTDFWNGTKLQ